MKMNKKEFLSSLTRAYARLGTGKNGVGVFAIRDIPRGTDPFQLCDPFGGVLQISEEELSAARAPVEVKTMVKDFFALQGGHYFVPDYGIDAIDKSYYLNHSSTPNMKPKNKGVSFLTARKIKKGEELTVDYSGYTEVSHFTRR